MRSLKFLLFVFIISACGPSKKSTLKKLQGHWHGLKPYSPTLDIVDSVVMVNKYSMIEWPPVFQLFDSTQQKIFLPEFHSHGIVSGVDKFYFIQDTLVYDTLFPDCFYSKCQQLKFVEADPEKCKWSHALQQNSQILTKFPVQTKKLVDWDSLKRKLITSILIGIPTQDYLEKKPRIRVWDVFIDIRDIPVFVHRTQDADFNRQARLLLVVDESVPKTFVDSVINVIPKSDSIKLFRLVKAKNSDELGYERMN